MVKSRSPIRVSPLFKKRIEEMQRKMRINGVKISERELTERISKYPEFDIIEQKILENNIIRKVRFKFDRSGV